MTVVEAQSRDSDGILDCWNAGSLFDVLTPALLEEKVWQDPGLEESRTVVAREGEAVLGFAQAVSRPAFDVLKSVVVRPEWRRKGIGSRLAHRVLAGWSREIRVAESAPNYLTPGLDVRDEGSQAFLETLGFREFGRTVNLRVDLGNLPRAGNVPGFRLARAQPSDRAAVLELIERIWPAWRGEVEAALRRSLPGLFLAWTGDAVAAFSAHDANNRGTGWFGPMGTDPDHRGRGLGRELLVRSLLDLRRGGQEQAVIPWVGPIEFYADAVGARVDRRFVRLKRESVLGQDSPD
ncbi:MAG: GNAT family N-acetyltransferase [Rhodothermales bacterium]|nr:GNAT family N-acetyltransferase [Rhodothermales bacterium]MBO6780557.1 GNAT family N-acetyltransferase [Rhodothermales bacterium]